MNLTQFRAQYPQYQEVPDQDLANALHQKFYSDVPFADFSKAFVGEPASPSLMDVGKQVAAGLIPDNVAAVGKLANRMGQSLGVPDIGSDVQRAGTAMGEAIDKSMTPSGQAAQKNPIFNDDGSLGPTPGGSFTLQMARSLPSMLAMAVPGAAGARTIETLAAGGLQKLAQYGGAFKFIAERLPSALGYGGAEGAQAALMNGAQTEDEILKMAPRTLEQSPLYGMFLAQTDERLTPEMRAKAAREGLARAAANQVANQTFLSTGGIGAATGGGAVGMVDRKLLQQAKSSMLRTFFKDARAETIQEGPQSAGEQYIQNLAQRGYVDPNKDVNQGVVGAGLSGAAVGAATGGAFGVGGRLLNRSAETNTLTAEQAPVPLSAPDTTPPQVSPIPQDGGVTPTPHQDALQAGLEVLKAPTLDDAINAAQASVEPSESAAAATPDRENLGLEITDSVKARPSSTPTAMQLAFEKAGVVSQETPVAESPASPEAIGTSELSTMGMEELRKTWNLTRSPELRVEVEQEVQKRLVNLDNAGEGPDVQGTQPAQQTPVTPPVIENPAVESSAGGVNGIQDRSGRPGELAAPTVLPGGAAPALTQESSGRAGLSPPSGHTQPELEVPGGRARGLTEPPSRPANAFAINGVAQPARPLAPPTREPRALTGQESQKQPVTPEFSAAPRQPEALIEPPRQPNENKSPLKTPSNQLLNLVQKLGGIKSSFARDLIGEKNAMKIGGPAARVFRLQGKGLDEMATLLHERGWLSDAQIEDVDGGVQALRDLIRDAVDGRLQPTLESDFEAQAQALADRYEDQKPREWHTLTDEEQDAEAYRIVGAEEGLSAQPETESSSDTQGPLEREPGDDTDAERTAATEAAGQVSDASTRSNEGPDRSVVGENGRGPVGENPDQLDLTTESNAEILQREKAQPQAEQKQIADREREHFALQVPEGTTEAQPLAEPKNQQPLFSRARNLDLNALVQRTTEKWTNAPKVKVISDMSQAPSAVQSVNAKQSEGGAENEPQAFFHHGTVYLVSSQIKNERDAVTALFHESLGHFGLRGVFGDRLSNILNQIVVGRTSEVKAKAKEYGLDWNNKTDRLIAAEEVLAELAQTRPELNLVQRAIAAIRSFLKDLGFNLELSNNDAINDFLLPAQRFVEHGGSANQMEQISRFHRAFHGSPHDFEEFSLHKIGTGEGAQAYGYGLYFAGKKEVAEYYRDTLAYNPKHPLEARVWLDDAGPHELHWWLQGDEFNAAQGNLLRTMAMDSGHREQMMKGNVLGALRDTINYRRAIREKYPASAPDVLLDAAESLIPRVRDVPAAKGRLYEVELAPKEDEYLDWDKPLSEQSESVQKALDKSELGLRDMAYALSHKQDPTGQALYKAAVQASYSDVRPQDFGARAERASKLLASLGVPGIKYLDGSSRNKGEGHHNYVIFDDKLVKVEAKFMRGSKSWDAPEPSKMDNVIYTLQNKLIDTKRVIESIRKTSGTISDALNVYLQEELYHGRSAKRVQDFINHELKPLITDIALRKVSIDDFQRYLQARHAEERNVQIAKINPALPDGGSGMMTQDAKDYLAKLSPHDRTAFEALAKRVDAINAETRRELVASGLESQETIDAWEKAYKHYVPLMREDMEGSPGIGQGFAVKGSASKRATGSKRNVVDILANVAQQRERAIVRGEKNRVSTALVGLAEANPNNEFWRVDQPPKIKYVDERTGLVTSTVDPLYKSRENVITARIPDANGEIVEHAVIFNEQDERALRMVKALKNLDMDDLGTILTTSAKITRYFASVNTQFNPIFGVVNLTRDTQGALFNLSTTPIRGKQVEVLKNIVSALKGVYIDLRDERAGITPTSSWALLWEEFQKEGGQTAYRDLFRTSKDRAEAIKREITRVSEGKAKQFGRGIFDWLSDYNSAMENATRLATYKVGKEHGMSNAQAASMAKNITVNFNRKGQITTQAGALYAFFNAGVQGTARLAETLNGPSGRKIIVGGITLGVMQALMLAAAGFDDDEPPAFVRERNLIIPLGDKRYITIPMPLGLHVLPSIGRVPTEFVLSGFRSPGKRVGDLFSLLVDAFNPVGGGASLLQTLTPTMADPIAALAENRDWTGKPIAKVADGLNPKPGPALAKDTATGFGKAISKALNWASGGTTYKPGLFSPTPDQIDFLIGQVTGGVGREIAKTEQFVASRFSGEDLPTYKVPLLGRFYGTAEESSAQASRFYDNVKRLAEHEAEIKGRRKAGEPIGEYLNENPEARLFQQANHIEREIGKLRARKREMIEKDASRESIKIIEEQINQRMKAFNERVKAARRVPA